MVIVSFKLKKYLRIIMPVNQIFHSSALLLPIEIYQVNASSCRMFCSSKLTYKDTHHKFAEG